MATKGRPFTVRLRLEPSRGLCDSVPPKTARRRHPDPHSFRLVDFGMTVCGVQRMLGNLSQEDWVDRVEWMRKGGIAPT